jgi:hypothetical protein
LEEKKEVEVEEVGGTTSRKLISLSNLKTG